MLNWLTRYAFVSAELDFDPSGALRESVLDVGCGPHGLSTAAPWATFAGVDLSFPGPVAPGMIAFRNQPGPLPFVNGAFDTVVCLDVLEHIPPAARESFVEELGRVAARRVLLACPSDEGAWIDDLLRDAYRERGLPVPPWLAEHDEHGLPTAQEIAGFCAAPAGFRARELTMTNGLLSALVVIADMLPEFGERAAREWCQQRRGWLELFQTGRFGSCHRKGYAIERVVPHQAVVDAARMLETVWLAVRCPLCSAATWDGGACLTCGYAAVLDPAGAWDLTTPACECGDSRQEIVMPCPEPQAAEPEQPSTPEPAPSPLPVRPWVGCRLLLRPDWERPSDWLSVVASYVGRADPDGDTLLCVDATTGRLALGAIHQMLSIACEAICGERPFANVVVLDAPYDPDRLIPVRTAEDVAAYVPLAPYVRPATPDEVERHARGVKLVLDSLRAVIERFRYLNAPDPWADDTPLVSVRIATWKGHRLLVERAIPSVLNGTYQNVEVVVCSDGPDPDAGAAVAGITDPRVRYLELPERPRYPEQSWSFWETAGIHAVNRALDACRGAFIAPLDHDDAFTREHVATLLATSSEQRADLVYGQALMEETDATWRTCGALPPAHGHIAHGSVLYSARLGHMRLDPDCWLLNEPGDWNMWRRMLAAGAGVAFVPQVVLAHFRERTSIESRDDDRGIDDLQVRRADEVAADVARTGLDWLLDIPLVASWALAAS